MNNAATQTAETLAKVHEILRGGPSQDIIKTLLGVDDVRKDYPTGLVGYDLEPAARVLQPVITPLRNRIPRVKGKGGSAAHWKQITSLNTSLTTTFSAFGSKAPVLSYTASDISATYKSLAMGDNVAFENIQQSLGLEDAKAQMVTRLLENVMILEEQALIGASNVALGTVTAPTVTTAATGGTVAANTYYVVCRACIGITKPLASSSIAGGTVPGSRGKKSTQTSIATSGSTSTISASTPAVDGAAFYEWYVGTTNNSTSETLEAVTTINSVLLTAIAGTGATIPADNSSDTNAFNGMLSQGSNQGSGTAWGNFGYAKTLATGTAGTGTTFALSDVDTMLLNLYNSYGADPELLVMNPQQSYDFTAKVRAAGLLRQVVENGGNDKIVGGSRVNSYANPITGRVMDVVQDPWWPQGTIAAVSLSLPPAIPLGEIKNAWEIKTQLDYYQIEYAIVAPKYETEVRSLEALAGYFILGTGIITNIANG